SARLTPPSVARPNWRARPPRPSRNAARPKRRRRPQPNWRAKRKRPPPGSWRSKPNARRRATRATPPAKSENNSDGFGPGNATTAQASRWGEPVDAKARCLVFLHCVVFLHAVLLHAIILLHAVLGHRVLLHRVLGHGVFLHGVVLAHLVLSEGGRRERQAKRTRGKGYAERHAGANGPQLVFRADQCEG